MTIHPLSRRGAPPTVTWTDRLGSAQSEAEVVEIVREYLALVSPEEFASLPMACRPAKIVDGADISAYAFELVRCRAEDREVTDRVHRIAAVLSFAATRLSALLAHHGERSTPQGSRQSA